MVPHFEQYTAFPPSCCLAGSGAAASYVGLCKRSIRSARDKCSVWPMSPHLIFFGPYNNSGGAPLKTRPLLVVLPLTIFFALAALAQQSPVKHFDGSSWWEHVKFLADDKLEGRETGSEGLRTAEAYVVDQLIKAGLQPAGVNGFYQPVKFVSREIVEEDSSAALVFTGKAEPLILGDDAYFNTRVDLAPEEISAPMVFAGYALKIPEMNYDDLAGQDLKGKIVVYLAGSTAETPGALSAHYQTIGERWKALRQAGVIGVVGIPNPASMDIPWSRMSVSRTHASMDLVGDEFNETSGLKLSLTFNPAQDEKLFAGSGHLLA